MSTIEAPHWRDVPAGQWRWRRFKPQELADRVSGQLKISTVLLDKLEALREALGAPLVITSGYRSAAHNVEVGGKAASQHLLGTAVDVAMAGHDPAHVYDLAHDLGFTGFGFYPGQNFMHLDIGKARWWGEPKPWGIDPLRKARAIAARAGKGGVGLSLASEPLQQLAYQLQLVADLSDYVRIAAATLGAAGILLMLWSNFAGKKARW